MGLVIQHFDVLFAHLGNRINFVHIDLHAVQFGSQILDAVRDREEKIQIDFRQSRQMVFFDGPFHVAHIQLVKIDAVLDFLFAVAQITKVADQFRLFLVDFRKALADFFVIFADNRVGNFMFLHHLIVVTQGFIFLQQLLFELLRAAQFILVQEVILGDAVDFKQHIAITLQDMIHFLLQIRCMTAHKILGFHFFLHDGIDRFDIAFDLIHLLAGFIDVGKADGIFCFLDLFFDSSDLSGDIHTFENVLLIQQALVAVFQIIHLFFILCFDFFVQLRDLFNDFFHHQQILLDAGQDFFGFHMVALVRQRVEFREIQLHVIQVLFQRFDGRTECKAVRQ
ncbi:hypothetical protein SDC9_116378 [bioreactor metagenome]|uniref:NAD-specific glutamate dehydrogenase n=1 Tax=bioreactor metagenome TaxID=1076179 RepID=A0A645C259_9ZZZZ